MSLGNNFRSPQKFHFGVGRAQQLLFGKAGQIGACDIKLGILILIIGNAVELMTRNILLNILHE
jgi:hypothetical protein